MRRSQIVRRRLYGPKVTLGSIETRAIGPSRYATTPSAGIFNGKDSGHVVPLQVFSSPLKQQRSLSTTSLTEVTPEKFPSLSSAPSFDFESVEESFQILESLIQKQASNCRNPPVVNADQQAQVTGEKAIRLYPEDPSSLRGKATFAVEARENVARVEYMLDGEVVTERDRPPFRARIPSQR